MLNVNCEEITNAYLVPRHKFTYAIGCFEKKITIYSQQIRAFNLAYFLIKEKKVNKDAEIAIIGGGISGITAAAAFSSRGFRVTLFEKSNQLMSLQRGETNRFIHPGIYDWPLEYSIEELTDLPFLNWNAEMSNDVVSQLDDGFKKFSQLIKINLSGNVKSIIEKGDHVVLELDRISNNRFSYPIVIYAGGFGLEKDNLKQLSNSYWRCESLHQENLGKSKTIIVVGTGDGGLIDCQRAVIENFDHEKVVNSIINNTEFKKLSEKVYELEKGIYSISDPKAQAEKLWEIYENLLIPNDLAEFIAAHKRKDIDKVILYGKYKSPLSLRTSLLNRIVIYILLYKSLIEYRDEEMTKRLADELKKDENVIIIERCGTEEVWRKFFQYGVDFEKQLIEN